MAPVGYVLQRTGPTGALEYLGVLGYSLEDYGRWSMVWTGKRTHAHIFRTVRKARVAVRGYESARIVPVTADDINPILWRLKETP